ncbi:MAG: class I SAM-dependent methyltransferase [Mangrovibacterium sp.]
MMENFWDQRYAADEYAYGIKPNVYFRDVMGQLNPGKLLLPGEGEGRNAVFAASLGWQVTAFDYSSEARRKAQLLAARRGVSVDYRVESYDEVQFSPDAFDALAFIFTHMPLGNRSFYHQKLLRYLAPGGVLILEGFSKAQIDYRTGGPSNPDMLFSREELAADFASLSELSITEAEIDINEGRFHQGKAAVIRVLGFK